MGEMTESRNRVSECLSDIQTARPTLFSLQHNQQPHYPEHDRLQPRMFRQQDGHVANKGDIRKHAPDDVPPLQVVLSPSVQFRVVSGVVVAFGQDLGVRAGNEMSGRG